eukprot:353376-Chlamydomonas_euryale.AAC.6
MVKWGALSLSRPEGDKGAQSHLQFLIFRSAIFWKRPSQSCPLTCNLAFKLLYFQVGRCIAHISYLSHCGTSSCRRFGIAS